jgi:hypothetical protein
LPFAISFLAVGLILSRILFKVPEKKIFLNPLLLASLYGLVGLVAVLKSPDGSLAFRWVFLYLSVPLVLWAIVSGPDPLGHLQRLINFNSLVIILAATGLFAVALLKLQLPELIFNPPEFLECRYGGWYNLTSGRLRDTGVGRYAAIAIIIALSGLWRPRWRPVWIFVLVTSTALLLFSGARGAFGGIVPGVGLVILANGGKKALVAGVVVILLLTPLALSTGAHRTFIDNCLFPGLIYLPDKTIQVAPELTSQSGSGESNQEIPGTESGPGKVQLPVTPTEIAGAEPPVGVTATALPEQPPVPPTKSVAQSDPSGESNQEIPGTESGPGKVQLPVTPTEIAGAEPPVGVTATALPEQPPVPPTKSVAQPDPSDHRVFPPSDLLFGVVPKSFFKFTGRAAVWVDGLRLLKDSPVIGYGFNADRLLLNTHMHNSVMQALIQTGLLGTLLFISAMLMGWVLLFKSLRNLGRLPSEQKHLVIQAGGILAFLTVRSFPESTGAFFGVDWLILAPILLYLYTINFPRRELKT